VAVGILVVVGCFYPYARDMVSSVIEPNWTYDGVTVSNFNVRMLILFGVAGGGSGWLVYKFAKRNGTVVAALTAFIAALAMAMNEIMYYAVPTIVLIALIIYRVHIYRIGG